MQLVTYNIRYGLGRDGKYDLARIADTVRGADVIALQEVERYWQRSGMTDQPRIIADLLPDYFWVYGPAFDCDASTKADDGTVINRRRQFGTMLLSKTPITYSKLLGLDKIASTSCFNMEQGALEGVIETKAGPVRFYSLHLSSLSERERMLQTEQILAHHRNWQRNGAAWTGNDKTANSRWSEGASPPHATPNAILMGDFNMQQGSQTYGILDAHHEPDYGRVSYIDEFVDSLKLIPDGAEQTPYTYWTDEPDRDQEKLRLDYCFVSTDLTDYIKHAYCDVTAQGSDHFPYWIETDL